jgi:hypothetical protein
MIKFHNSFREYTLSGKIGSIWQSKHIGNIVFDLDVTYEDLFSKRPTRETLLIYPHMNPLTLNGKQYKIETNDDVLAFHSVLEAASVEDILNDKGDTGKQESD